MVTMPLSRIPSGELRRIVVPVLVVWLVAWLPFLLIGEPNEMVRLQLAGSESEAREIVAAWSQRELVDMGVLLGVDGVHLVSYGLLMTVAAVWAGRRLRIGAAHWAPAVAWMALMAAAFDVVENAGMIAMIRGEFDASLPTITTAFSLAKYATLVLVVLYVIAGIVASVAARLLERTSHDAA